MKSRCSFFFKALTAMVLVLLLLFGTVSTSLAAVVERADTGAQADLAGTGIAWSSMHVHIGAASNDVISLADLTCDSDGDCSWVATADTTIYFKYYYSPWSLYLGTSNSSGESVSFNSNYIARQAGAYEYGDYPFYISVKKGITYVFDMNNFWESNDHNTMQFQIHPRFTEGATLYIDGQTYWPKGSTNGTKVGAYFFGGGLASAEWVDGVACGDTDNNVYKVAVPDDLPETVILVTGTSITDGSWGTIKGQTNNISSSEGLNYKLTSAGSDDRNTKATYSTSSITTHDTHTLNRYAYIRNTNAGAYNQSGGVTTTHPDCDAATVDLTDDFSDPAGYTLDGWYSTMTSGTPSNAVADPSAAPNKVTGTYYACYTLDSAPTITSFTAGESTLKLGEETRLSSTVENSSNTVVYSIKDDGVSSSVVSLTDTNLVTAMAPGTATLVATLTDGGNTYTDELTITVVTPTIASFSYAKSNILVSDTSSPTISLTSGTYNAESVITYHYSTSSTYGTVNATSGVIKAASNKATTANQTVSVYATVEYNGKSYDTAATTANFTVYAYYLNGFFGSGSQYWTDGANAVMFTYDDDSETYRASATLSGSGTYAANNNNNGFKVWRSTGTNKYFSRGTTTISEGGSGYGTAQLWNNNSAGNMGLTPNSSVSSGTYIFEITNLPSTPGESDSVDLKVYYPHAITYNANGHGDAPSARVYTYGADLSDTSGWTVDSTQSGDGYTFKGWYQEAGCENEFSFTGTVTANDTAYAKWAANSYTVTLNDNGGSGGDGTKSVTMDAAMTELTNIPSRTGYTFDGYYANNDGTGTKYYNANGTSAHAWDIVGNATIYAKWVEKEASGVSVVASTNNGTSGGMVIISGSSAVTDGTLSTVGITTYQTLQVDPATGYTFSGWTVTGTDKSKIRIKTTAGVQIFDGSDFASDTADTAEIRVYTDGSIAGAADVTITANYTANSQTLNIYRGSRTSDSVNYAVDDGLFSYVTYSGNVTTGSTVTVTAEAVEGYKFVGFFGTFDYTDEVQLTDTDENGMTYTFTVPNSATNVYVRYEKGADVTFNKGDHGAFSEYEDDSVTEFVYNGDTPTAPTIVADAGYRFTGWNTTVVAVGLQSTYTYTAQYEAIVYTINTGAKAMTTDVSGFATDLGYARVTVTDDASPVANAASYASIAYNHEITLTAPLTYTSGSTYSLVGWLIENNAASGAPASYSITSSYPTGVTVETVSTNSVVSFTTTQENTYFNVYALYAKQYTISVFKSYELIAEGVSEQYTTPPRTVKVTSVNGDTVTYTYSPQYDAEYGGVDGTQVLTAAQLVGTNFGNGAEIPVLAGDEVVLTYAALPATDAIKGVFYNNTDTYYDPPAPGHYHAFAYTYGETHDNADKGALYVNGAFYTPSKANVNEATVNQNDRTVTFTIKNMDYKNISLEHAGKRRFIFRSTTGANVLSESINNYYLFGTQVGALDGTLATFGVKAATSSKAVYTLTPANVKFYTDSTYTTELAAGLGVSIANTADANGYYAITCASMPDCDIYVDLNIATSYTVYLSSRMVSDMTLSYKNWAKVADVKISNNGTDFVTSDAADDETDPNKYKNVTVAAGSSATLNWNWTSTATTNNYDKVYTFLGWYKGDSSGPDYANGFLKDLSLVNATDVTYTPTGNTYIYAVGTRNLYINGSKYITGEDDDWHKEGGVQTNIPMSFDPDYVNPDGGAAGRYYWTITPEMFARAAAITTTVNDTNSGRSGTNNGYYIAGNGYGDEGTLNGHQFYLTASNTDIGNGFFQILDSATGTSKTYWSNIEDFYNGSELDVCFAKAYPDNSSSLADGKERGLGFVVFNSIQSSSQFTSYKAPITIYAYPGKGISVSSTPKEASIYVSDGLKGVGEVEATLSSTTVTKNTSTIVSVDDSGWKTCDASAKLLRSGDGWNPTVEGHVSHIRMTAKNTTIRLSKTVDDAYKVAAFVVYNLSADTVYAITPDSTLTVENVPTVYYSNTSISGQYTSFGAPTGTATSYTAVLTMSDENGDGVEDDLYIIPVLEDQLATMTIEFDASDMSTSKWGDLVSCYAWYSGEGTGDAYGSYPGQLMIPNPETNVWTAKIVPTKGDHDLVGVLFANFYEEDKNGGSTNVGKTWISASSVYDGKIIKTYNTINSGSKYAKSNFKAQTYDYVEPVTLFKKAGAGTTITFTLKDGNSNDVLAMRHTELIDTTSANSVTGQTNNLFTGLEHTHSDPGEAKSSLKLDPSANFEYLTDSSGKCIDLNGVRLANTPNPSYYIVAKGMVRYYDGNMDRVFFSDNYYETSNYADALTADATLSKGTYTRIASYGTDSITNAVQWYIYDSNGNYLTSILSDGLANVTDGVSKVSQAVAATAGGDPTGKSAMICYDIPRMCYSSSNLDTNSEKTFDAYRFTGQWYSTTDVPTVTATVKVGYMTSDKFVLSDSNSASYGHASAKYVQSRTPGSTVWSYVEPAMNNMYDYITFAKSEVSLTPVQLIATVDSDMTAAEFVGWYTYNETADTITPVSDSPTEFYPTLAKDTTYYAMFNINVSYTFNYTGRQGRACSVTVTDKDGITTAELEAGAINLSNAYRTSQYTKYFNDVKNTYAVFHKNITLPGSGSASGFGATFNCVTAPTTGALTAYVNSTSATKTGVSYGTVVDFSKDSTFTSLYSSLPADFVGWYEYNPATEAIGDLISSNPKFGMVYTFTESKTVIGLTNTDPLKPSVDYTWKSSIDENVVSMERYDGNDFVYNDFAVRYTNAAEGTDAAAPAKYGVLMIMTDADSGTVNIQDILTAITSGSSDYRTKVEGFITSGANKNVKLAAHSSAGNYTTRLVLLSGNSISTYNRADIAIRSAADAYPGYTYRAVSFMYDGSNYYFSTQCSGEYPAAE